ncbi:hypothetical protein AVEN_75007-1 [Araneus ventricosus]|uniref:Uncharacterized protein n=1 Tax=Araneus ventricosus TaxID=182803 RepID=A0A4Y2MRC0_ARAVE|nr:hypothetical protein AVEN_75007-1 [Araneus ventricosus]
MSQQPTFRAYSSPQALGKAVRKVKKSFPSSPRIKQAVMEKLASHIGLLIPSTKPQKKNGLSVKAFYYWDDVSRQLPGKKNVKSIRNIEINKKSTFAETCVNVQLKRCISVI